MELSFTMYDDNFPTCAVTYATLHIQHEDLDPDAVSRDLDIQPTRTQRQGEPRNPRSKRPVIARFGMWSLSSEDAVHSRDVRRHIDWLIDHLQCKAKILRRLRATGCETKISCFWVTASAHGGPTLSPFQLARLADLGLDTEFDIYFGGEEGD
jgi:hypothetical protein